MSRQKQRHPVDAPDISAAPEPHSHLGRPISWVTVFAMLFGFTLGGYGLTQGPSWVIVAIGAAIFVVGGVVAYFIGIFKDTGVVDEPAHYHDDGAEQGEHTLGEEEHRRGGHIP